MKLHIDTSNIEDYRRFLAIKRLPQFKFVGRTAEFPDEYAATLGISLPIVHHKRYGASDFLFDYQKDISRLAIKKKKFALFIDCGYGKSLIYFEYIKHVLKSLPKGKCVLMIAPLMVVEQLMGELVRFYGEELPIEQVAARNLAEWVTSGKSRLGITNYDALHEGIPQGRLGALILDESSCLASHYGKWGQEIIRLGRGLEWKLAGTGTPAPNDRIEYANHAVFLDHFPTVNSFLARFFINRGETQERWEIKPHAIKPFYRALSHWCIFMSNPATYGWNDNTTNIPPIHVHIHDVPMTAQQRDMVMDRTGQLIVSQLGGIANRSTLGQIAKGHFNGIDIFSHKPEFIKGLVESWPDESTLLWCIYDKEQDLMEKTFPSAHSMRGSTPHETRRMMIADFQSLVVRQMVSKSKILGMGLNLQVATRQLFSGLQDSYLSYYQCVKRSNRVGSTRPLNVHLPVTEVERPMIDNRFV